MINPQVHIPYGKIEKHLPFIIKERLNLEVYFDSVSLDRISPADIDKLGKILEYKPVLTIHAPFMDLSPGAADSRIRAVTTERFSQTLDIAEILKPKAIVFHSGYEKWRFALRADLWLEASLLTWKPLIKRAEALGVKIAIENIFEDEPQNLELLMKELGTAHFGICFDTGHFNLFSKPPLKEWLDALQPYIIELHLHDNKKTFDSHNPIGDGTFDFDTLFSVLRNKDLIYTLEAHNEEDVKKSMEGLRKYI